MLLNRYEIIVNTRFDWLIKRGEKLLEDELYSFIEVKYLNNNLLIIKMIFEDGINDSETSVAVLINGTINKKTCTCEDYEKYKNCKHTAAAMVYLSKMSDNEKLPFNYGAIKGSEDYEYKKLYRLALYGNEVVKEFNEEFKNEISLLNIKNKVKLVPEFTVDNDSVILRFKIGINRLYIVKDFMELVVSVHGKKQFRYGKELDIIHDIKMFDDDSLQWFNFLENVRKIKGLYSDGKEIVCDYKIKPLLFDTIEKLNDNSQCDIEINSGELIFDVEKATVKNSNFYKVKMQKLNFDFYEGSAYQIEQLQPFKIVKTEFDDFGSIEKLARKFRDEEIYFTDKGFNEFYKYSISQIEDYVTIRGIELEFKKAENVKLFGDIDEDGNFIFDIEYFQDNIKHLGFVSDDLPLSIFKIDSMLKALNGILLDNGTYLLDPEDNDVIDFIQNRIYILQNECSIFVSDTLKNHGKTKKLGISIGVNVNNNLLELDLSADDVDREEIINILRNFRKKKKYTKLKNGETIQIHSEEIEKLNSTLESLGIVDLEDELSVSSYRTLSIDDLIADEEIEVIRSDSFKKYIERFDNKEISDSDVPTLYQNILRDYQVHGYKWLKKMNDFGFGAILADDMGLGKTIQMISYLQSVKDKGKSIVITPASLILNWQEELEKFTTDFKVKLIMGNIEERQALINDIENYNLIITSYDYIKKDYGLYKDIEFETIVLDEAQYIKNQKTKAAIAVKSLNGRQRFALTGTPIENNLAELWSIFDFLMPKYLYSYRYFRKNYEVEIVKNNDIETSNRLKKLVEPFILRRHKKDVLKDLPSKVEHDIKIEFNDNERNLYLAQISAVNEELQDKLKLKAQDKIRILSMITRLRQLCCEPRIIDESITDPSSKLIECLRLVNKLNDEKKNILIFSSFTKTLDLIEDELILNNISYLKLTGKDNKIKRKEMVDEFQKGQTKVFLISLKAGGTGLNLTSAQAVIHFDPWWNISAQNQATDRAHRFGQTKQVDVYKLIIKDTIEEKILALQERKKAMVDTFIEGSEGALDSLSLDDIIDLFK